MEVIFSPVGILTFFALFAIFFLSAGSLTFGALSLPCVTILTSLVYFFFIPWCFLEGGDTAFYGLYLDNLELVHAALLLYILGASAAFFTGRRVMMLDPAASQQFERKINPTMFWVLLAIALAGVAAKVATGRLAFSSIDEASMESETSGVGFLNLAFSLLIPLTIYALVKQNFNVRSILMLMGVLFVFLTAGFRFRILILVSAAFLSFAITRRLRIRVELVAAASVLVLMVSNAIGMSRTYGRGIDLSLLEGKGWSELLKSFGGEVGPLFVLVHVVNNPPSQLIYFDPWIVAIARLVPSFLWPNKPFPDYLVLYPNGFPDARALTAGIAGTQHAEFLLQFGWFGLPVLAFLFSSLAIYVIRRLMRLSREARIAGCAIVPALFGFYAQQRGYAFQIFCELIFTLLPLFLLHLGAARRPQGSRHSKGLPDPGLYRPVETRAPKLKDGRRSSRHGLR